MSCLCTCHHLQEENPNFCDPLAWFNNFLKLVNRDSFWFRFHHVQWFAHNFVPLVWRLHIWSTRVSLCIPIICFYLLQSPEVVFVSRMPALSNCMDIIHNPGRVEWSRVHVLSFTSYHSIDVNRNGQFCLCESGHWCFACFITHLSKNSSESILTQQVTTSSFFSIFFWGTQEAYDHMATFSRHVWRRFHGHELNHQPLHLVLGTSPLPSGNFGSSRTE